MLQPQNSQQLDFYEDPGERFDPSYLIGIFRRKILFFAVPFLLVAALGFVIFEMQRPIYRSEGRILVQSPEIPPDLVRPTITEVAEDRVQVIKQRILARDNLLAIMNKYNLFARERGTMSATELLDLIRSRTEIKPIEPDAQILKRQNMPAIAFTLSFDYEVPDLAMKVANEFLTGLLNEDASTRANNAAEATKFLEGEVRRLQSEHDAVIARLVALKQQAPEPVNTRPIAPEETESDEVRTQKRNLADLEAELARRSSVYSDEHPVIKNLKRNIAELKRLIASAPKPEVDTTKVRPNASASRSDARTEQGENVQTLALARQELALQKALEEANNKLSAARLGERMERGQQGERLQVIEQPSMPQKPIKPEKLKWIAIIFALSGIIGTGCVILAETFDGSIRGSRELAKIIDRDLIVTLPYLSKLSEAEQKRRNFMIVSAAAVVFLAVAAAGAAFEAGSIDLVGQSWGGDVLSRLSR
jgi:uncharacterized protein involved in exopolysaccharide biosynthesis